MKLTISSKTLGYIVATATKLIPSKNAVPICDCVRLFQHEGDWWLTGGSADTQVTMAVPVTAQEGEAEDVCILASKFMQTLNNLPDAPLTLETKENQVIIKCGKGKYKLPSQSAVEYPAITGLENPVLSVKIPGSEYATNMKAALAARSDDELRPQLGGVALDVIDGAVTFVASDGHRMYTYTSTAERTNGENKVILFPAVMANCAQFFKAASEVVVNYYEHHIVVYSDGISMVTPALEGKYPNYKSVIPSLSTSKTIICNKKDLINAISRVSVLASDTSRLLSLTVDGDSLILEGQDIDFNSSATENIDIIHTDVKNGFRIGCHANHFQQLIRNVKSENIQLKVTDPSRAIVMVDDNDTQPMLALLMPMILE